MKGTEKAPDRVTKAVISERESVCVSVYVCYRGHLNFS